MTFSLTSTHTRPNIISCLCVCVIYAHSITTHTARSSSRRKLFLGVHWSVGRSVGVVCSLFDCPHSVLLCPVCSLSVCSLFVLLCPVLFCSVLFCPVLSSPVLSCPVLSSPVLFCLDICLSRLCPVCLRPSHVCLHRGKGESERVSVKTRVRRVRVQRDREE